MIETGWFVVMTKPRMEVHAEKNLERQGFKAYLPRWVELKRRADSWQGVESIMFPRYLFVKPVKDEQSLSPIGSTRGVSQLVRFGAMPARASEELIREIQRLGAARNALSNQLSPFEYGDEVVVMSGPFKGVSAKVLSCGQERVILLLQILGKIQRLELNSGICRVS